MLVVGALQSLSVNSATVHTLPFRSLPFRTNRFALFCAPYFRIAAARVRFVRGPTFPFRSVSACCLFERAARASGLCAFALSADRLLRALCAHTD